VPDQVFYYFQIIVLEPNQNDFHIENHERHKVRIGFAQEKYPRNPWELWGTFVQGFSLILEVEYRLRKGVRGKFSIRACEDFVASAAKYFKPPPHLDRLGLLTSIGNLRSGHLQRQTSNYTYPWIAGDLHMLKRDRLLICRSPRYT
jgi:hypothetical protein